MDLEISDGEIVIEAGELQFVTGTDAIAQHVATRMRLFKGEWFLDRNIGVPYFDEVMVKTQDAALIAPIFRRVIEETPGIESVDRLDVELDSTTRTLSIEGEATSADGPVDLSVEIVF